MGSGDGSRMMVARGHVWDGEWGIAGTFAGYFKSVEESFGHVLWTFVCIMDFVGCVRSPQLHDFVLYAWCDWPIDAASVSAIHPAIQAMHSLL